MIILVTVSVFLATALGFVVLFWWWEARKESLPRRIEEVTAFAGEHSGSTFDRVRRWIAGIRERFSAKTPFGEEEIIAIVTGKELSGGRLLLNQAGYRTMMAYQIYWIVRVILPVLLGVLAFGYGKAVGMPVGKLLVADLRGGRSRSGPPRFPPPEEDRIGRKTSRMPFRTAWTSWSSASRRDSASTPPS